MSDTPRTDEVSHNVGELAMLARKLERELVEAKEDTARLDWLEDVNNHIGNVLLPRSIVEQNLDSMRHAIDVARGAKK